jgi:hypothetical protein
MTDAAKERRSIGEILRHPLANVVVGFVLTGVIGTAITQYYIALREKQAQQRELSSTRKESIAELSALNAEYLARAEMVLAAIDRGDEGSTKELKAAFDDAALRWQTEKAPTLMAARDVLPHEIYLEFRDKLNRGFRDRFLVPFGKCVNSAVDARAEGEDVASILRNCRAREYLAQASTCSQTLLDMLYELSGYTVERKMAQALQANRDTYRAALQQACSLSE